ncbi:hypothetical protein ACP70R_032735 [Stipagrostis hirtigluma subsp. patula]
MNLGDCSSGNSDFSVRGRGLRDVSSNGAEHSARVPDVRVKLNSSFAASRVSEIFSSFHGEKKELLEGIGFGGLMRIPPQDRFNRKFALWLLCNLDCSTLCLKSPGIGKLKIHDSDIHLILGLPKSCKQVLYPGITSQKDVQQVNNIVTMRDGQKLSLEYLEKLIVQPYPNKMTERERQAFQVACVLYADAFFLSPHGTPAKINIEIFRSLLQPERIREYNWSGYVLQCLKEAARRIQAALKKPIKAVILGGCLLALQIFYLDNLELGPFKSRCVRVPRVVDFTSEKLKMMITADCVHIGGKATNQFGCCKLRSASEVIYARGKAKEGTGYSDTSNMVEKFESFILGRG